MALFGVGGGTPGAYHSGLSYLRGTHYESVPGKSIPYVENGSSASRCWFVWTLVTTSFRMACMHPRSPQPNVEKIVDANMSEVKGLSRHWKMGRGDGRPTS